MFDEPQMNAWITGASAYCCQPLKDFANNPVWTADPIHAPYAKASATLRPNGYAGPLGYASAGVMADYVLVDMFAEAVTGQATPEDAIAKRREARQPLLPGLDDPFRGTAAVGAGGRDPSSPADRQIGAAAWPMSTIASRPSTTLLRACCARLDREPQRPRPPVHAAGGGLLLLFLTYPLGPRRLARLHRHADRPAGRLRRAGELRAISGTTASSGSSVFNTLLYTVVASVLKFALGLWLALILNENLPFKTFFRAIVLLPWVVPTVLSAIAFWWIFDASSRSSPGR